MEYSYIADLLSKFHLSNDWIKALIIITPPLFFLGVYYIFSWYRLELKSRTMLHYNNDNFAGKINHEYSAERYFVNRYGKDFDYEHALRLTELSAEDRMELARKLVESDEP